MMLGMFPIHFCFAVEFAFKVKVQWKVEINGGETAEGSSLISVREMICHGVFLPWLAFFFFQTAIWITQEKASYARTDTAAHYFKCAEDTCKKATSRLLSI